MNTYMDEWVSVGSRGVEVRGTIEGVMKNEGAPCRREYCTQSPKIWLRHRVRYPRRSRLSFDAGGGRRDEYDVQAY